MKRARPLTEVEMRRWIRSLPSSEKANQDYQKVIKLRNMHERPIPNWTPPEDTARPRIGICG